MLLFNANFNSFSYSYSPIGFTNSQQQKDNSTYFDAPWPASVRPRHSLANLDDLPHMTLTLFWCTFTRIACPQYSFIRPQCSVAHYHSLFHSTSMLHCTLSFGLASLTIFFFHCRPTTSCAQHPASLPTLHCMLWGHRP